MNHASSKPLITTIIPTYRRPKMLRRAIRSVLNQTYQHFQVCIYDNASGDETPCVAAEMAKKDPRVKYHCHPENIGALANFNYGMAHVDTQFFSFLSDDDFLLPNFYEIALEGFEKHPRAIFSATAVIHLFDQDNIGSIPVLAWEAGFYQPPEGLLTMLKYQHPTWTGILFRREIVEKVGFLDQQIGVASDLEFELRIAAHFPFVISLEPGAIFVAHPEATCIQAKLQDIWPGWLKIIRNLKEDEHIPLNVRIFAEQVLKSRLKKRLFFIGLKSILQRNNEDSNKVAKILRKYYHQNNKAFFLQIIAKICNYFSPAYYFCIFLYRFRKFLLLKKSRPKQKKYREIMSLYHCKI